jgi:hypothetical protein
MRWTCRSCFVLLVLIASFAVTGAAAQADGPRATQVTPFSYEDLTRWILETRPEVADRPIRLAILWNRTDSVWGQGSEYQVLPNVWRNQLLSQLLDNFLVRGYERPDGIVQGDRITMLAFGRQQVDTVVPDQPFTREARLQILNAYPEPFVNTPRELWNLDLNEHLNEAIALLGSSYQDENLLLLIVTDPIQQGGETMRVDAARDFRTYRGFWTDQLNREFTIYLYWNDFPNEVRFTYYDEASDSVLPHPRDQRAPAQRNNLLPPERYGTSATPPLPQELQVALTGDGQGAIRSAPAGIDTGAGASTASFGRSTVVTLTADPAGRSRFAGFQSAGGTPYPCGAGSGPGRCVVTMDVPRAVYGAFVLPAPFNWWPLIVTAVIVALVGFTLYVWLAERYEVRDENGLLDRTVFVFPTKTKRIPVPNPAQPSEAIGHLSVVRPLPFGLSRLRFTPVKGVVASLEGKRRHERGAGGGEVGASGAGTSGAGRGRSGRGRRRGSEPKRGPRALVLQAGQRKPERQVLRYRRLEAPGAAAVGDDGDPADAPSTAHAGTMALLVQRRVQGRAGKQRQRRAKAGKDDGRASRASGVGRGRRRIGLADEEQGEGA